MGGVPVISIKDADCVAAFVRKTFVEANEAAFIIELQNLLASCNTLGGISWNIGTLHKPLARGVNPW